MHPTSRLARSPRGAARMAYTLGALFGLMTACHELHGKAPTPDIQTTKPSAHQLYRATVRLNATPIPIQRMQSWTLHLETADGRPIDDATITMTGGMPQHGHGLPTAPRVTRGMGNGDHVVEGVKFNMGGWWVVRFAIRSAAGMDTVTFNLSL